MPSRKVKQIGRKTQSANMKHKDCPCTMRGGDARAAKKLTPSQKYRQLKRHTENAGMSVREVDGKIVVKES